MSDPDRDSDTELTRCRLASGDGPDAHADEATEPNPPSCADTSESSGENDTDDFLRWLPTLALGHRRRTEIVERPSSDGADFAVYACEGHPAATSGHARVESAVNVQAARDSKDLQRDAPTVLTRERRARRGWRSIGWAALGAAAAGAVLSAWAWRPVTPDEAPSTPVPIGSPRPPLTEPSPSSAAADREAASRIPCRGSDDGCGSKIRGRERTRGRWSSQERRGRQWQAHRLVGTRPSRAAGPRADRPRQGPVLRGAMRFAVTFRRVGLCITACALVWTNRAPAGEPDARERSVALFKEGVTAGKAGDYARAEEAFRTSYALLASASTLRNWALTEMHLGKMVEALGHLRVALRSPGWTAAQRSIVQQNFDDAYAATGHVALRTTEGARVAVDGVMVEGAAPFDGPLDVLPGSRRIEARLGAQVAQAEVDAPPGQVVQMDLPVAAPRPEPPAPPSALEARTSATREQVGAQPSGEPLRTATWWTAPHAGAVGLAGAGAVGLALGLYFDARSSGAASDAGGLRSALAGQCMGPAVASGCGALRATRSRRSTQTRPSRTLPLPPVRRPPSAPRWCWPWPAPGRWFGPDRCDGRRSSHRGRRALRGLSKGGQRGDAKVALAVHRRVGCSGRLQPVGRRRLLLAGIASSAPRPTRPQERQRPTQRPTAEGEAEVAPSGCDPTRAPHDEPCVIDDAFGVFVFAFRLRREPGLEARRPCGPSATRWIWPRLQPSASTSAAARTRKSSWSARRATAVNVYGALDCATWTYGASNKVVVAPTQSGYALEVEGLQIGVDAFEDIEFDALSAANVGESSVAVFVSGSGNVALQRVTIMAGTGSDGMPGPPQGPSDWYGTLQATRSSMGC